MSDLQEHIKGLQDVLVDLQAEEEVIRRELLAHQNQVRRVSRALDILTERERQTTKKKSGNNQWQPKRANVEKVYETVREGHQTTTEIITASGLSHSTVGKALNVLRTEERIRKTGKVQAGNSTQKVTTYAVMPQAVTDAA